jgi:hypothetical protein
MYRIHAETPLASARWQSGFGSGAGIFDTGRKAFRKAVDECRR